MESLKDKVAIVGMGCTKFGERWDKGVEDLLVEAAYEAFEDAGIEPKDIQAAWIGTVFSGLSAITLSPLGLQYIPMTRVENMCATGSEALRGASYAIMAGACDVALAIGVEKLKDSGTTGVKGPAIVGDNIDGTSGIGPGYSAPASFAYMGTRYFNDYKLAPEEGKRLLAEIAVKNHHNGSLNPKACQAAGLGFVVVVEDLLVDFASDGVLGGVLVFDTSEFEKCVSVAGGLDQLVLMCVGKVLRRAVGDLDELRLRALAMFEQPVEHLAGVMTTRVEEDNHAMVRLEVDTGGVDSSSDVLGGFADALQSGNLRLDLLLERDDHGAGIVGPEVERILNPVLLQGLVERSQQVSAGIDHAPLVGVGHGNAPTVMEGLQAFEWASGKIVHHDQHRTR